MGWKRNVWLGLLAALVIPLVFEGTAEAKKAVPAKLSAKKAAVGRQVSVKTSVKRATYTSSNSTVASVNADGVVTAKKAGKVKIKVTCAGYKPAVCELEVGNKAKKPTLPVALDEVEQRRMKMKKDSSGRQAYYATIKNKAKQGKIRKVEYYYRIQSQVTVEPTAKPTASADVVSSRPTAGPTRCKVKKTVVLRASNIKAGKSVRAKCEGDASGDVSRMQLKKIVLHTGNAVYTYNLETGKKSLKWGGVDKKAPVFSGWVGKKSYYGKEAIRVCYADRKKTYKFKDHVKAVDERDGNVKFQVDTSRINWKKDGIYRVYYRAKDKAGNVGTAWAKVQVFVPSTAESIADELLSGIVKKGWSQEKKLRAIYDYVHTHCAYVDSGSHTNWRGTAVNGIRFQSGDCYTYYAMARLLITRAGIPNLTVTRYPARKGYEHWWNLVYVRGGWYHFDTVPRSRKAKFCLQTDAQLRLYSTGSTFRFQSDKLPKRAKKKISQDPVSA